MQYISTFLFVITTFNIMAQKEIKTSIIIEAPAQDVWEVLTDFNSYELWNPFLTEMKGTFKEGDRVKINASGMKFRPIILKNIPPEELRWKGKFLFNGLFDGEHSFKIIDNYDGTITFLHEEKFTGVLVGIFSKKLDKETKSGFEKMNAALKKLVESKE